jgi:hypothetical protein
MNRTAALLIALAAGASAHVVSMSSGDLTVDGSRAHYELRMPQYEVAHIKEPERALLSHIRFWSGGGEGRLAAAHCAPDPAHESYICTADYVFAASVEQIDVECTFAAITVPNHVHLLRAQLGQKQDQAVFDAAFPRATLRFRPPTAVETAAVQSGAGFVRALGGAVQVLLLAALVLAARGRRELAWIATMFLAGQMAAVVIVPHLSWQPAPRFVEAAMALAVAYLAVEVLLLPQAGARWAVAGVLGIFYGLYFCLFLQNTDYRAGLVMAGAAVAELTAISILAAVFSQVRKVRAIRPVQVSAAGLLMFGMTWFILRLRG